MKIKRCLSFFLLSVLLLSGLPLYAAGHPQLEQQGNELARDFQPDLTVYIAAALQQADQGLSFSNSRISKIEEDKGYYYLGLSSQESNGFQAILQRDKGDITAFRLIAEGEILDFRIVHNQLWTMMKNGEALTLYVNDGQSIRDSVEAGSSLQLVPNAAYAWSEGHLLYVKTTEPGTVYAWDGQAEAAYKAGFSIEGFTEYQNCLYIADTNGQVFMFNGRDTLTGQDRVDPVDRSYTKIVMDQIGRTLYCIDEGYAFSCPQGFQRFLDSANNNWYFNLGNCPIPYTNIRDGAVELLAGGASIYYDLSKEPSSCPGTKLCYNGLQVNSAGVPYIREGHVFVPVRSAAALLNAELRWENGRKVSLLQQSQRLTLEIDSETAWMNEAAFHLAVAPEMKEGELMVPLRLVGEAFDFVVTWDQTEQAANISLKNTEIIEGEES